MNDKNHTHTQCFFTYEAKALIFFFMYTRDDEQTKFIFLYFINVPSVWRFLFFYFPIKMQTNDAQLPNSNDLSCIWISQTSLIDQREFFYHFVFLFMFRFCFSTATRTGMKSGRGQVSSSVTFFSQWLNRAYTCKLPLSHIRL